jgi:type I restriction enzyme S subunit
MTETAKQNVPQLRYPEFDGEWEIDRISNLLINYRLGGNYKNSQSVTKFPLIKMGNLSRGHIDLTTLEYIVEHETIIKEDKIKFGDLFFNTRNTLELVGKVSIWLNELPVAYYNSNLLKLEFLNNQFMNFNLNTHKNRKSLKRIASGTTSVAAIYTRDLLKMFISFPTLPEQQKIADFLTAVDKKIAQLEEKKTLLEAYKKGCMQKLFSQALRFKDDDGNDYPDWEYINAGQLFESVSNKNHSGDLPILAITQDMGATLRNNLEKDIYSSDASIKSYKIVEPNDFIISLRSFQGGIEHSKVLGICSPAYTILRSTEPIGDGFFKNLFKKEDFISRLSATVVGIREGKQISYAAFSTLTLPFPRIDEQQKIANFLSAIDEKITHASTQLDHAKTFKKGLLQKMFV